MMTTFFPVFPSRIFVGQWYQSEAYVQVFWQTLAKWPYSSILQCFIIYPYTERKKTITFLFINLKIRPVNLRIIFASKLSLYFFYIYYILKQYKIIIRAWSINRYIYCGHMYYHPIKNWLFLKILVILIHVL